MSALACGSGNLPGCHTYKLEFTSGVYVASVDDRPIAQSENVALPALELVWRISFDAIGALGDRLAFHAGAISVDGVGVLLPARSGGGKSTLTAALVQSGAGYLSDEVAPVEGHTILAFPRPLGLKSPSVPLLGDLADKVDESPLADVALGQVIVDPDDLRPESVSAPTPLSLVVFPSYEPGASTTVEELSRAEGTIELLRNCFTFERLGSLGLKATAAAAVQARFYRLRTGDLAEAVTAVLGLAGTAAHDAR